MLMVLLSWVYIGIFCLTAGTAVFTLIERMTGVRAAGFRSVTATVMCGLTALTVAAEWFSLFAGIGALCHLAFLSLLLLCVIFSRKLRGELRERARRVIRLMRLREGAFCVLLLFVIAFFSSRGSFHTDTNIYHAQAIRIIEEYGAVRGIANLQLHFGYNSAYLVLCAFFTLRWLLPQALHTVTGFLAALLLCYACRGLLRSVRSRGLRASDGARTALLFYVMTNLTGLMSPATDYGTLLFVHYLLCAWLELKEREQAAGAPAARTEKASGDELPSYCALSVLALFAAGLKLSSALLSLLVLYPVCIGIRRRKGKWLVPFFLMGMVSFIPFLIRNVVLSGWLVYPFEALDFFSVPWKVPAEYSRVDSAQIKVWGRCLYDTALADTPLRGWLPVWWEAQPHYAQMLIYANFLSPVLLASAFFLRLRRIRQERRGGTADKAAGGERIFQGSLAVYLLAVTASMALWFFTAPFVRYGLAFLLTLPLVSAGDFIEELRGTPGTLWRIPGVFAAVCTGICFGAWIDNYAMDALVFIKGNLAEPYYVVQKPFENRPEEAIALTGASKAGEGGIVVYCPLEEEMNSYYVFPSSAYRFMIDRTEPMGETVRDGFRAK
ncbi:LIC_10190 family membrane protein [Lachnoclostridium sp. Marseille-P6806]|uniref:LIC_10190 family membrane protein n=1 Tax=Lachnoclostridium sp. Marseille-P6806 TaxID=2364793 RepID=UPI0010310202|nr:hypothetical protein [Lachnoclostridium sp. Marseille-P6806]